MKPLILVKHSLPQIVERIPAREWNLSQEGRSRAQTLAGLLSTYQPEVVISSSEPKATQTAEVISEQLRVPCQVFENLHEHDRWGSPYLGKVEFEQLVHEFFAKPEKLVFGNETARQVVDRFRKAIENAVAQFEHRTIVIVTHGTALALFVEWLTGVNGYELWHKLGLPSFVVLELQSKKIIETINLS